MEILAIISPPACTEYGIVPQIEVSANPNHPNSSTTTGSTETAETSTVFSSEMSIPLTPYQIINACGYLDSNVCPTSLVDGSIPDNCDPLLDEYQQTTASELVEVHGTSLEDITAEKIDLTLVLEYFGVLYTNPDDSRFNQTAVVGEFFIVPGDHRGYFLEQGIEFFEESGGFSFGYLAENPAVNLGTLGCDVVGSFDEKKLPIKDKGFFIGQRFVGPIPDIDAEYDYEENAYVDIGTTAEIDVPGMTIDYVDNYLSKIYYETDYKVDTGLEIARYPAEDLLRSAIAFTGGIATYEYYLFEEPTTDSYDLTQFWHFDVETRNWTKFYEKPD